MTLELPTRDDVLAARETIAGRVHRTPTFTSSTLGERIGADALPEGRAVPEDRLVQAARGADEARRAERRGEGARRRHLVGRQPRAGGRLGGRARGDRLPRRHVRRRQPAQGRCDARLRRRRSTSRRPSTPRRTSGCCEIIEEIGPHLRAAVRRSARDRRAGNGRARDRRGRARRRPDRLPDRRRRADRRHRDGGRHAAIVGVEPELSAAFTAGLAAGKSVRIELLPTTADGLAAPFAGELNLAICARARRRGRARHRGRDRGGHALPLRAREARLRAGRRGRDRRPARRARSRVEPGSTVVAIVSGGNAAAKVASAILAEADEG